MTIASSLRSAAPVPSKGGVTAFLLAGIVLATPSLTSAASTFATFDSTTSGSLNGVNFAVSSLSNASIYTGDFSGGDWNNAGSQRYLDYLQNDTSTFTINFASAVSNLEMYLYYFRGDNNGFGDGYNSYTFSESFSVTAGLTGVSVSGATLDTSSVTFASGVLSFTGSVTSLTITTTGTATGGFAGFTMAQSAAPPAVPGLAGLGMLAGVSLAGRRRRR